MENNFRKEDKNSKTQRNKNFQEGNSKINKKRKSLESKKVNQNLFLIFLKESKDSERFLQK
jgi:hypothetical protein